ncbi:MAG: Rrf2 family transcriptional regulator [Salinisphaeraceae bacterium]
MRLTSRGRYAVSAMVDLARHGADEPVCVAAVARRQGISPAYLERLFRQLRQQGLLRSTRGARGGYRLGRGVAGITVSDVLSAVGESLDATACGSPEACRDDQRCDTHGLWAGLTRHVEEYLGAITLAELEARSAAAAATVESA